LVCGNTGLGIYYAQAIKLYELKKTILFMAVVLGMASCTHRRPRINEAWKTLTPQERRLCTAAGADYQTFCKQDSLTQDSIVKIAKSHFQMVDDLAMDLNALAMEMDSISKAKGYGINVEFVKQ
jgi:hypothetical protein